MILGIILALITGFIVGAMLGAIRDAWSFCGYFIIDTSDPERDIYRVDLNSPIESKQNFIMLKVRRDVKLQSASETGFLMKEV